MNKPEQSTLHIVFPLLHRQEIRLPDGSKITGVSIDADITQLDVSMPVSTILSPGDEWQPHIIRTFLAGEMDHDTRAEIPIPDPSPTLRPIGVLETVETPATWHIFEEITMDEYIARGICSRCGATGMHEEALLCRPEMDEYGDYSECPGSVLWLDEYAPGAMSWNHGDTSIEHPGFDETSARQHIPAGWVAVDGGLTMDGDQAWNPYSTEWEKMRMPGMDLAGYFLVIRKTQQQP